MGLRLFFKWCILRPPSQFREEKFCWDFFLNETIENWIEIPMYVPLRSNSTIPSCMGSCEVHWRSKTEIKTPHYNNTNNKIFKRNSSSEHFYFCEILWRLKSGICGKHLLKSLGIERDRFFFSKNFVSIYLNVLSIPCGRALRKSSSFVFMFLDCYTYYVRFQWFSVRIMRHRVYY